MASVSGSCLVSKISGMIYVQEEVTPSVLEWKAIDQLKIITIPLNCLKKLQAPKESSPKMMLRILYQLSGSEEEKDLRLSFTNRPTMNNIKESLQTIIARLKTIIKDSPTPQFSNSSLQSQNGTPQPSQSSTSSPVPSAPASSSASASALTNPTNLLDFSDPASLSDPNLLKNHQLQQKLLLEDKNLRNIFTQSVINFKLSPSIFWSTRLNHLRTYALTISQHRGPYNVLSTIKPVATSDNQVNVNVTRDTINEIFDTYPIIKRAFKELVPHKFNEGEFWSRFFNSKLFRRLRGDKINTINTRGDVVLDKYLYIDVEFLARQEREREMEKQQELEDDKENGVKRETDISIIQLNQPDNTDKDLITSPSEVHVSKFIDLLGNEDDNSQKLGNKPDITMRFTDENSKLNSSKVKSSGQENEMIILMKNMNKLSSKIISMNSILQPNTTSKSSNKKIDDLSPDEINEFQTELNLHDLNETEELEYIQLNLANNIQYDKNLNNDDVSSTSSINFKSQDLIEYFQDNTFKATTNGINLNDTYKLKEDEINKSANDIIGITKANFKNYKLINNLKDSTNLSSNNVISDTIYQELITFNITIMEFLSHFWKIFLNGNNPVQLKRIFTSLKNCKNSLNELSNNIIEVFNKHDIIKSNEKLKEKLIKDLNNCILPLQSGLDKAIAEYISAVKAISQDNSEINENGKRALKA